MAIRFLADGNIDNDLQIQSQLIVGDGSASYSKILNNALTLYDSAGDSKGQFFINESGSSHVLMINNGATGGTVYFGAPTSYVQNVIIQGGTLTIGGISNALSDTDKFLVSDGGEVKYRTGAEVRSDIGAGTGSGSVTSVGLSVDTTDALDVVATSTPVTGSGTLELSWQGLDTQVVLGDGTLTTLPTGTITGSGTSTRVAVWNGNTDLTDSLRLVFGASTTFFNNTTSTPIQMQNDGGVGTVKFEGSATSNSSTVQITPGTESKPGLNFGMRSGTGAQDTDTGIFSSAANKMEFATGGSERIQITSNGTKLTTLSALTTAASTFLISDGNIVKAEGPTSRSNWRP